MSEIIAHVYAVGDDTVDEKGWNLNQHASGSHSWMGAKPSTCTRVQTTSAAAAGCDGENARNVSQKSTKQGHQWKWGWERRYGMYEERGGSETYSSQERGRRKGPQKVVWSPGSMKGWTWTTMVINFKWIQWAKLCISLQPCSPERDRRRGGQVSWGYKLEVIICGQNVWPGISAQ